MRIGVFGDEFADKHADDGIWWKYLISDHGHAVVCHGEAGSSIVYSARLIESMASQYDFMIWCVAHPARFSYRQPKTDNVCHGFHDQHADPAWPKNALIPHKMYLDYKNNVEDLGDLNYQAQQVVNGILRDHANIMLIPSHRPPLGSMFNLDAVSEFELANVFPGVSRANIYKRYRDTRPGLITPHNAKILAGAVNWHMAPGIFTMLMDRFRAPQTVDELVHRI